MSARRTNTDVRSLRPRARERSTTQSARRQRRATRAQHTHHQRRAMPPLQRAADRVRPSDVGG
eukprot:11176944-Lingulodinium_polyedra.AAC.1